MNESHSGGAARGPDAVDALRRRLRALEASRQTVLDAVPVAAAEVDAGGRVVACNRRFAALCGGASPADLAGAPLAGLATGAARLERRPLPLSEGVLVVEAADGPPTAGADAADRVRAEEARRLESLGALAGGVAHDFNNLLTGVIGFVSLARQQTAPDSPVQDYLGRALEAAGRAAELAGQMLAYAGRGRFVVAPLDLSQAVRDLAARLRASVSPKAALTTELADNLPPVLADASQLRQAILNLVQNASEALGEQGGDIVVRTGGRRCDREYLRHTYLDDELPEGDYVFVEVADAGGGMDAATQRRVFEPFFTTKILGRGLGLAAVLGIVRGHRGAIELTSAPGRGTTVRVLFPAGGRREPADDSPQPAHAGRPPGEVVLFVDDEPALRDLAVRSLRPAGYAVLTAADGRQALQVLRDHAETVRAVVLDLMMPGPEAADTIRELRGVCPGLPVILSSGLAAPDLVYRLTAEGAAGFLQKPYRPQQLLEQLRQALERRDRAEET